MNTLHLLLCACLLFGTCKCGSHRWQGGGAPECVALPVAASCVVTQTNRGWQDMVLLTTLSHIPACVILASCESAVYVCYTIIAIASCAVSVAWHRRREPRGLLFIVDYALACAWTAMEVALAAGVSASSVLLVLFLNATTLAANWACDRLARDQVMTYDDGHSLWHVWSGIKVACIAILVKCP